MRQLHDHAQIARSTCSPWAGDIVFKRLVVVFALVMGAVAANADEILPLIASDTSVFASPTDNARFSLQRHIDRYRTIHASYRASALSESFTDSWRTLGCSRSAYIRSDTGHDHR